MPSGGSWSARELVRQRSYSALESLPGNRYQGVNRLSAVFESNRCGEAAILSLLAMSYSVAKLSTVNDWTIMVKF